MHFNRKLITMISMVATVTMVVAFTSPAPPENGFTNLKILPKDISHEKLNKIMYGYNTALGVKCNFCHAASKDAAVHHPDFASDEKPEKEITRSMMKMTIKINKKFFQVKHPFIGDSTLTVTCITCHHGEPHPEEQPSGEHGNGEHPGGPPPPPGEKH